jgi:hypothetical protein
MERFPLTPEEQNHAMVLYNLRARCQIKGAPCQGSGSPGSPRSQRSDTEKCLCSQIELKFDETGFLQHKLMLETFVKQFDKPTDSPLIIRRFMKWNSRSPVISGHLHVYASKNDPAHAQEVLEAIYSHCDNSDSDYRKFIIAFRSRKLFDTYCDEFRYKPYKISRNLHKISQNLLLKMSSIVTQEQFHQFVMWTVIEYTDMKVFGSSVVAKLSGIPAHDLDVVDHENDLDVVDHENDLDVVDHENDLDVVDHENEFDKLLDLLTKLSCTVNEEPEPKSRRMRYLDEQHCGVHRKVTIAHNKLLLKIDCISNRVFAEMPLDFEAMSLVMQFHTEMFAEDGEVQAFVSTRGSVSETVVKVLDDAKNRILRFAAFEMKSHKNLYSLLKAFIRLNAKIASGWKIPDGIPLERCQEYITYRETRARFAARLDHFLPVPGITALVADYVGSHFDPKRNPVRNLGGCREECRVGVLGDFLYVTPCCRRSQCIACSVGNMAPSRLTIEEYKCKYCVTRQ